jgi:phosphohistidine phosphatase SixA
MKKSKFIFLVRHAATIAFGYHEVLSENGLKQVEKICYAARARMFPLRTSKIRVFSSGTQSSLLTARIIAASLGVSITPVTDLSLSVEPGNRKGLKEILDNIDKRAADDEIIIVVGHHDQIAEMPETLVKELLGGGIKLPFFEKKHVLHGAFFEFNLEAGKCFLNQPPTPVH